MFRLRSTSGGCNARAVLSRFSLLMGPKSEVKVVKEGKAKGSALLGVLTNQVPLSSNGHVVKRAMGVTCCARRDRSVSRGGHVVRCLGRATRIIRASSNGAVSTTRVLRHFLFPTCSRNAPVHGLSNKRGHELCLLGVLVSRPGILLLSRPAGGLSARALAILRSCLRSFPNMIVAISRSHCFLSGITRRLLMLGNRNGVRSCCKGCDRFLRDRGTGPIRRTSRTPGGTERAGPGGGEVDCGRGGR